MTYFAFFGFIAILASLAAALFFMLRGGNKGSDSSKRMANALALRVAFSIALLICILVGWKLGIIHPTGIAPGR